MYTSGRAVNNAQVEGIPPQAALARSLAGEGREGRDASCCDIKFDLKRHAYNFCYYLILGIKKQETGWRLKALRLKNR